MADLADFYSIQFAAEFDLLTDTENFDDTPGIYIIYTSEACLEIVDTEHLRTDVETNTNTKEWLKRANDKTIFVAIHFDDDAASRQEKVRHLTEKMKPILQSRR